MGCSLMQEKQNAISSARQVNKICPGAVHEVRVGRCMRGNCVRFLGKSF